MYNIPMEKFKKIAKGSLISIYLLILMYGLYINQAITAKYNIPEESIPIIAIISTLLFGFYCIKALLKADQLEFEFTSIVNHAFRTPLTRIVWLTKELEKELPREQRLLYLQNIENTTNRIISIVDIIAGIKDINNPFGYVFQVVSIREIVEASIEKHREGIKQKNITFQVSTFKDVPLLTLDVKKISFVFDTVIENAIFYTPKDGHITIDYKPSSDKIIFFVQDTGLGLSFMEKMRLFSKFHRGEKARLMNTDGMGLALYLAKTIIKRHKGALYATSSGRDKGATFYIELPIGK